MATRALYRGRHSRRTACLWVLAFVLLPALVMGQEFRRLRIDTNAIRKVQANRTIDTPRLQFRPGALELNRIKADTTPEFTPVRVQIAQINPELLKLKPEENVRTLKIGDKIAPVISNLKFQTKGAAATKTYALPTAYVTRLRDNEVTYLQPVFNTDKLMHYDAEASDFVGSIYILLEDPAAPTQQRTLAEPIVMEVRSSVDVVNPATIRFQHTNIPSQTVIFRDKNPRDSISIRLITPTNNEGYEMSLGVEPTLRMETKGRRLQGLGLQAIPVTLTLHGGTLNGDSIEVTLDVSKGSVTPAKVFVSADKSGIAWLRSENTGPATLTASSAYGSVNRKFQFVFPSLFFIAALLGGFLGSLIYPIYQRSQSNPVPFGPHIAGGVIAGLIVAGAYSLGFTALIDTLFKGLIPVYPTLSEALIFVVAALAGMGWSKLKSGIGGQSDGKG